MLKIYAIHDECHGNIGCYADFAKAQKSCKENAKGYDIDPDKEPLDYEGEKYWGWAYSYIETIEVIE